MYLTENKEKIVKNVNSCITFEQLFEYAATLHRGPDDLDAWVEIRTEINNRYREIQNMYKREDTEPRLPLYLDC